MVPPFHFWALQKLDGCIITQFLHFFNSEIASFSVVRTFVFGRIPYRALNIPYIRRFHPAVSSVCTVLSSIASIFFTIKAAEISLFSIYGLLQD